MYMAKTNRCKKKRASWRFGSRRRSRSRTAHWQRPTCISSAEDPRAAAKNLELTEFRSAELLSVWRQNVNLATKPGKKSESFWRSVSETNRDVKLLVKTQNAYQCFSSEKESTMARKRFPTMRKGQTVLWKRNASPGKCTKHRKKWCRIYQSQENTLHAVNTLKRSVIAKRSRGKSIRTAAS